MIYVFTGFATIFADMGFGAALVQNLDVQQHHKNAVFWLSIALGALITLLLAAAAPYIASFYREPALQPLTVAISLVFFINAFTTVQFALLQKAMDFRTIAAVQLTGTVLSGLIGICLAFWGMEHRSNADCSCSHQCCGAVDHYAVATKFLSAMGCVEGPFKVQQKLVWLSLIQLLGAQC
jgi:hypothetical protein